MWLDTKTGLVVKTHSDARAARKNWSAPNELTDAMLLDQGFLPVTLVSPVFTAATQKAVEVAPLFVEGAWTQQWEIVALTEPELQLEADLTRARAKEARAEVVNRIKVTTQAGNTFDGDEVSQGRMARAIIALQATATPTVRWVLANNEPAEVSAAELVAALALAGAAQAAVWVIE